MRFDIDALAKTVCESTNRPLSELVDISKLSEGGYNRILEVRFGYGYTVLARLPYNNTVPKHYAVASEAATLDFLRSNGIAVPRVLGYSPVKMNPVGTEYLLMEKLDGIPLSSWWFTMDTKTRVKVMRQIVDLEKQFLNISLPASGSLYYGRDLVESGHTTVKVPSSLPDQIVVGPTAQLEWWYGKRSLLIVDRGPCESLSLSLSFSPTNYEYIMTTETGKTFREAFEAPAKREIQFCQEYGKPRLHVERYLREIHNFEKMLPENHIQRLSEYLLLASTLDIPLDHRFARPVLRHPDFSPNNILINPSSNSEITGIIDWQHSVALPLCLCAGIPQHFQNWGDPISETLSKPDMKLPEDLIL